MLHLDTLSNEILWTYALVFGRDGNSRSSVNIAKDLFRKENGLGLTYIKWKDLEDSGDGRAKDKLQGLDKEKTVIITEWDPRMLNALRVFPIFGPRLKMLKQEMLNWKPRRLVELFTPGYANRYAYF